MLQGYFDDSGSDGNNQVTFVLADYILPAERWAAFLDDWQAECKRTPKTEYFKMSKAQAARDQFDGMSFEFRQCKVRDLLEVVKRHQLHGIATTLKWDDFREFNATAAGDAQDQPYAPLFFGTLDNVLAYEKAMGFSHTKYN
jgi:hypothetical protein